MAFCTNCGAATSLGERFCAVCGQPLAASSSLPAAPPPGEGELRRAGTDPARVVLGLSNVAPVQSRWSILFRLVICIPLFVWLVFVSFAAGVVLVISWFAALFMGRVPLPLQRFMTNALRYSAKVSAYASLLTAKWPGLGLAARPGDQMTLEIDHVRLNRAAVLFRIVLSLPSALVSAFVNLGSYFLTFVMWWCALVMGRVPQSLHEARGQVWRFSTRSSAYIQLLTPSQPFENFLGDQAGATGAAPAIGDDTAPGDPSRLSTTWTMSTAARVVLILTLVTGAYFQVQPGVTRWPTAYVVDRTMGPAVVKVINQAITTDLNAYALASSSCANSDLVCQQTVAASEQANLDRELRFMANLAPFVVRGRNEFRAYQNEVVIIDLTVEQIANSSSSAEQQQDLAALTSSDVPTLASLYQALHQAI